MVTRPAIRRIIQNKAQILQHPIEVLHHLAIGVAHRSEAVLPQHKLVGYGIALTVMCVAIDFDDEPKGGAEEVDDSLADHSLTAKLVTVQLVAAQGVPHAALWLGGILPEFGGAGTQGLACTSTTPNPLL